MSVRESARIGAVAAALAMAICNGASASPPSHRQLGARFKVLSAGQTVTLEIRVRPRASFDTVRVEAGSGVASLNPPCSFNDVVPGGSYVCRVSLARAPGEASATVNVVGEKRLEAGKPSLFEVSHFTIANPEFVAPTEKRSSKPTPGLELLRPRSAPKRG